MKPMQLITGALLTLCSFSAVAAEYISVNPSISPRSGKVESVMQIHISWPGVRLQMDTEDPDLFTLVDPSYITVKINGNEFMGFGDGTGNGRAMIKAQYSANEEEQTTQRMQDDFVIDLPDVAYWWNGTITVDVKEGAVMSTTGQINAPISLTYTVETKAGSPTWDPPQLTEDPVEFTEGDAIFYGVWDYKSKPVAISNSPQAFYQVIDEEGDIVERVNAGHLLEIENGRLKVDVSSLEPGVYNFVLPSGAVTFADGAISLESLYLFRIVEEDPTDEPPLLEIP